MIVAFVGSGGARNSIMGGMHNYAVNRKFKCLQYQLARLLFLLPEQRLVI